MLTLQSWPEFALHLSGNVASCERIGVPLVKHDPVPVNVDQQIRLTRLLE
jgi:hypothetical protein